MFVHLKVIGGIRSGPHTHTHTNTSPDSTTTTPHGWAGGRGVRTYTQFLAIRLVHIYLFQRCLGRVLHAPPPSVGRGLSSIASQANAASVWCVCVCECVCVCVLSVHGLGAKVWPFMRTRRLALGCCCCRSAGAEIEVPRQRATRDCFATNTHTQHMMPNG